MTTWKSGDFKVIISTDLIAEVLDKTISISTYVIFLILLVAGIKGGIFRAKGITLEDVDSSPPSQQTLNEQEKNQNTSENTAKSEHISPTHLAAKHNTNEEDKLLEYYTQALNQSKTSFWFSLIFASLGFCIIASSPFLYKDGGGLDVTMKLISGTIVTSVSSLFFIQSKRAQQAMITFFDKLRLDRLAVEAKTICNEIQNPDLKDKSKTILVLHNSGLDTSMLLPECKLLSPKN